MMLSSSVGLQLGSVIVSRASPRETSPSSTQCRSHKTCHIAKSGSQLYAPHGRNESYKSCYLLPSVIVHWKHDKKATNSIYLK